MVAFNYAANIRKWYARADSDEWIDGSHWYSRAFDAAQEINVATTCGIATSIGVIAALSPRNKWDRNLTDALNLITSPSADTVVSTPHSNKFKALRIIEGQNPWDVLRGNKVRSFYNCITNYATTDDVCIDSWAIRAATCGKKETATDKQYADIQKAYRKVAAEYGIKPHQLQAIVWVTIRNAS